MHVLWRRLVVDGRFHLIWRNACQYAGNGDGALFGSFNTLFCEPNNRNFPDMDVEASTISSMRNARAQVQGYMLPGSFLIMIVFPWIKKAMYTRVCNLVTRGRTHYSRPQATFNVARGRDSGVAWAYLPASASACASFDSVSPICRQDAC